MLEQKIMRPGLNSIRSFVVVARAGSFTKAADQLHVTQGAVSQQIAKLEDELGQRLFDRNGRSLSLTMAGQRLFRGVSRSIDRIDAEANAARSKQHTETLLITSNASFAAQWLAPRLADFEQRHPHIRLRCEATTRLVDYVEEGVDAGIRVGMGEWPGLTAEKLSPLNIVPVATPEYKNTLDLSSGPAALANYPLLLDLDSPTEWAQWFQSIGEADPELKLVHGFSDTLVTISALLHGVKGIALIGDILVEEELKNGSLVKVVEQPLEADYAYFLVYPAAHQTSGALAALREWMLDCAPI